MKPIKVFKPDSYIVEANIMGFLELEITEELCKHKSCGFEADDLVCPGCGDRHNPMGLAKYSHIICKKCKTDYLLGDQTILLSPCPCPTCGRERKIKLVFECHKCGNTYSSPRREGGTGPVRCKRRNRFRFINENKLANPTQDIKFAAISTNVYFKGDSLTRSHVLVVDFENGSFVDGFWAQNRSCVYEQDVPRSIHNISNLDEILKLVWKALRGETT